jgi:SAM-dependent methyltransferase
LGCGTGRHFNLLKTSSASLQSISQTWSTAHPIFADKSPSTDSTWLATFGALRESTFDLIYCIGVVGEYVPDAFLRRLHSLLRPGGIGSSRLRMPLAHQRAEKLARRSRDARWQIARLQR